MSKYNKEKLNQSVRQLEEALAILNGKSYEVELELTQFEKGKIKNLKKQAKLFNERTALNREIVQVERQRMRLYSILCGRELLWNEGLPSLGAKMWFGGFRGSKRHTSHAPTFIKETKIDIVEESAINLDVPSLIWMRYIQCNENLTWNSVMSLGSYVCCVMNDAITTANLSADIGYLEEFDTMPFCKDTAIIFRQNPLLRIGVVKIGVDSVMNDERIHGEMYDYMLHLHSYYGLPRVCSIFTTYKKWRIYWWNEQTSALVQNVEENEWRTFCASRIYNCDDPELGKALVSILLKTNSCQKQPVQMLDRARPYILLQKNVLCDWNWTMLSKKLKKLTYKFPIQDTTKMILLQDIGGQAHGHIWLVCTMEGTACMMKFGDFEDSRQERQLLEREAYFWKEIWGFDEVRLEKWAGKSALMIPIVKSFKTEDLAQTNRIKAIAEMIDMIIKKGYYHPYFCSRNIAFYEDESTSKLIAITFDMACMKALSENKKECAQQIKGMREEDEDIWKAIRALNKVD